MVLREKLAEARILTGNEGKATYRLDEGLIRELKIEAVRRKVPVSCLVQELLLDIVDYKMQAGEWGRYLT
jgi:hypothetical protein